MYKVYEPFTAEECLEYLRKSRSDDPTLTVDEVLANHELELNEWSACLRSNYIGSYMGFPKQIIYGGKADTNGNYIEDTGIKLFDDNGNEINPF